MLSIGRIRTKSRALLVIILGVLCFCVLPTAMASAEPSHLEKALKALAQHLKEEPNLEKLGEDSSGEQSEIERALADEDWLDQIYNSPVAPNVETLAGHMDPEDHAQFKTYLEALEKGTEDIPLASPEEAGLGADALETAGDAGIVATGTVTALVAGAAADGYLLYEDITTGTNPVYNFLVHTFAPEPFEQHLHAPHSPPPARVHHVGAHYPEYEELYGENAEELGLCADEWECLGYVYPWEFQGGRGACGVEIPYCGDSRNSFGTKVKFQEGEYEVIEVYHSGEWYVETENWYVNQELILEEATESVFPFSKYQVPNFKVVETPNEYSNNRVEEDCPGARPDAITGWPLYIKSFFMLMGEYPGTTEDLSFPFYKDGESCVGSYYDSDGTSISSVGATSLRAPINPTYVSLPNHKPYDAPAGKPKTDINEPSPGEQAKKLAEPGAVKPKTSKFIKEHTEEPPYGPLELIVPSCSGVSADDCKARLEYAGFTDVEIDPKTWEEADLSLPADATIETNPKEGEEADEEKKVKIIANPAEMPAVVPNPATEGELGTDFRTELDTQGWTDNEIDVVPESLIDTRVGPGGEIRTDPAGGTREAPGTEGSTKVIIVVNPADAPPPEPEHKKGLGGPTLPGFKLPNFAILCKGFPFGVPCWLAKTIENWSATAEAPKWGFDFELPFDGKGKKIKGNFDFAKLEPIMSKVRPVIVILATVGLVLLFYSFAKGGGPPSGSGMGGDDGNPIGYGEPGAEVEFE